MSDEPLRRGPYADHDVATDAVRRQPALLYERALEARMVAQAK
jgi:hypothetical protein